MNEFDEIDSYLDQVEKEINKVTLDGAVMKFKEAWAKLAVRGEIEYLPTFKPNKQKLGKWA